MNFLRRSIEAVGDRKISCLFLLLLCLFAVSISNAQVEINPGKLAFGTTTPMTQWIVDVIIKNEGNKTDYLLRTTFSHEYEVLFTSKKIEPDSVIHMRVKFKPRLKGEFNEKIELYFASMNEPVIFPVTANVQYLNPDDNIACPDFSRLAADCCVDNIFMAEVLNAETHEPLSNAEVVISESGVVRVKMITNENGQVSRAIPIGYYDLTASHKDYLPHTMSSYINNRNAYFRLEVMPVKNELIEEEPEEDLPEDSVFITSAMLPEDLYRPNNIVFLLDASSSMNKGDKMDLMRAAMQQLVSVLRPADRITLISYNDESSILLETVAGNEAAVIMSSVNALVADGNTAGSKGFKSAYDILRKEYIADGNNQLIVVTDGAFQPADQEIIEKLVKRSVRKRIKTSMVAVQANSYAEQSLGNVCATGNGAFIAIEDDADLHLILEEIKKRSAR